MTGLDHIVRRIGPVYRKVPGLHPLDRALEEAGGIWTKRGVPNAQINEVRFCYFELGWNDAQQYLQPAYLILATLFGPDRRVRKGDIVVTPAAVNSPGEIVPPPKRPKAPEPRGDVRAGKGD